MHIEGVCDSPWSPPAELLYGCTPILGERASIGDRAAIVHVGVYRRVTILQAETAGACRLIAVKLAPDWHERGASSCASASTKLKLKGAPQEPERHPTCVYIGEAGDDDGCRCLALYSTLEAGNGRLSAASWSADAPIELQPLPAPQQHGWQLSGHSVPVCVSPSGRYHVHAGVDFSSDKSNCGSRGCVCKDDEECVGGQCVPKPSAAAAGAATESKVESYAPRETQPPRDAVYDSVVRLFVPTSVSAVCNTFDNGTHVGYAGAFVDDDNMAYLQAKTGRLWMLTLRGAKAQSSACEWLAEPCDRLYADPRNKIVWVVSGLAYQEEGDEKATITVRRFLLHAGEKGTPWGSPLPVLRLEWPTNCVLFAGRAIPLDENRLLVRTQMGPVVLNALVPGDLAAGPSDSRIWQ